MASSGGRYAATSPTSDGWPGTSTGVPATAGAAAGLGAARPVTSTSVSASAAAAATAGPGATCTDAGSVGSVTPEGAVAGSTGAARRSGAPARLGVRRSAGPA